MYPRRHVLGVRGDAGRAAPATPASGHGVLGKARPTRRPPEKPRPAFRRTGRGGGDLTDPAPRGDCSPPRETEAHSFPPPAPQYSTHHEKARKQPGLRETQTKVTLGHLDARGTNGVGTAQASMAQHKPGDTSCGGEGWVQAGGTPTKSRIRKAGIPSGGWAGGPATEVTKTSPFLQV